jgi:hypothetical protein
LINSLVPRCQAAATDKAVDSLTRAATVSPLALPQAMIAVADLLPP